MPVVVIMLMDDAGLPTIHTEWCVLFVAVAVGTVADGTVADGTMVVTDTPVIPDSGFVALPNKTFTISVVPSCSVLDNSFNSPRPRQLDTYAPSKVVTSPYSTAEQVASDIACSHAAPYHAVGSH